MKVVDRVTMIHLPVRDMDRAKVFYTEKLGLKATGDYTNNGARWVPLDLPGGPSIVLTTYPANLMPGSMAIFFGTSDIEESYREVKANGVEPDGEIESDEYGRRFRIKDPDGNQLIVTQS